jgi:hypothetical protein
MNNILFYGNCQICPLQMVLNLSPHKYNVTVIECFSTNVTQIEIFNCIKDCDIIIMQNIQDNYRDKHYLSTSYIINNCKYNCKLIILDNCYFNFYYFDTTIRPFNNDFLWNPCLYHYSSFIEYYKNYNNQSTDYYIENIINNKLYKSTDELNKIANNGILELKKRFDKNLLLKNFYKNHNI